MASYPKINGRTFDHSSGEYEVNGKLYTAISAINWSHGLTPGEIKGSRPEVIARTTGDYEASGDFTIPLEDYAEIVAALGDGYMGESFDIVLNYSNDGMPNTNVLLAGCRIQTEDGGSETGGDAVEIEVDLHIMRVEINGIKPVPGMLS